MREDFLDIWDTLREQDIFCYYIDENNRRKFGIISLSENNTTVGFLQLNGEKYFLTDDVTVLPEICQRMKIKVVNLN